MFSDDSEQDLEFLTYIHDQIIDASGGTKGIHNEGLIRSALARPLQSAFGEDIYEDVFARAAALLYSIANNHGFRDGNKRTAMAAASYFLDSNDIDLDFTNQEYEDFMLHVVNDKPSIDEISTWLNSHTTPISPTNWQLVDARKINREHPDTFHIPTNADIGTLTIGSSVKLGFETHDDNAASERMWVVIIAKENDAFTGTLDNDPATIRGLKYKDVIHFKTANIMSIYTDSDK